MRILFIGAGDIGLPSLEALLASPEHEVVAVVTQPDKPVGRKQVLTPLPIKVRALEAGIPVLQPPRLRKAVEELLPYPADVFVVVAYGQILPKSVLDLPAKACLNIHASLLPRHRGAAPIQAAIRDGDTETGITIMWMDEGLDTGDMLLMTPLPILPEDTGGTLHDRLAALAPSCLEKALALVAAGTAPKIPQDHTRATYVAKLTKEQGRIQWSEPAARLALQVRAFHPWPGSYCFVPLGDGKTAQLKVHAVREAPAPAAPVPPGTVLEAGERWIVACGQGALELLEVQLEGRKRMPASDYLKGHPWPGGEKLE